MCQVRFAKVIKEAFGHQWFWVGHFHYNLVEVCPVDAGLHQMALLITTPAFDLLSVEDEVGRALSRGRLGKRLQGLSRCLFIVEWGGPEEWPQFCYWPFTFRLSASCRL